MYQKQLKNFEKNQFFVLEIQMYQIQYFLFCNDILDDEMMELIPVTTDLIVVIDF